MITVREMKTSDYVEVRKHLAQCWHETYSHMLQPSEFAEMSASLNDPNLGLIPPGALALIALETLKAQSGTLPKRVVGTAIAAERHGVGYVWGMYVATDKKRCGIGHSLLNEILVRLPSAKQLSVVVLRASSDAVAFYRGSGFTFDQDCSHELVPGKTEPASLFILNRVRT